MMILSLDNLAHRYHCLPSEVLERATTFDFHVLDVSTRWSRYQQEKADGKNSVRKMPNKEEMMNMLKFAREYKQ